MQTILAVDDEKSVRQSYEVILADRYRVLLAESGEKALETLRESNVDLILLDLMMPGMGGAGLLKELAKTGESAPVIVVTALNSVASAVEAMRLGARDYLIKPFDVQQILLTTERILEEQRERRELEVLREEGARMFGAIIGESAALKDALALAKQAAQVDSTVLITGESGTGKDLVARAIHSGGKRAEQAFVPLSCCAIPESLVESELFGHEKGAFTGATARRVGKMQVADGGALFLDEIGEMPLDAQAKLLRVLQDGRFYPVGSTRVVNVDVRFICATNRNLPEAVAEGVFREDLFYRINVLPVEMPPLRKRREDIPLLVNHFIAKHAPRVNAKTRAFAGEALAKLAGYPWPGNVRELENTVERILVHHGASETISGEHLQAILPGTNHARPSDGLADLEGLSLEEATMRLERRLIERALQRADYVQSRAAELLGTTRRILKYKMDQLDIPSRNAEHVEKSA